MDTLDTLILPKWLIPVEPRQMVLEGHGVAIQNGRIHDLGSAQALLSKYQFSQKIDLTQHALIPGLVNAHSHGPMALMRGVADDTPLEPWLTDHIWPLEQRWMSPEYVEDGMRLALAEMLLGGTTCVQEMYFFPDVIARTMADVGIRGCVGAVVIDFPSAWGEDAETYIRKALDLHDAYKGHPLISVAFAPHSTYTVAPEVLRRLGVLSDQLDLRIQIHLQETAQEVKDVVRMHGARPMALLRSLGLLTPSLTAIHMTQIEAEEVQWLTDCDASVVHCPESNLKLASGFCPVQDLLEAGVNVGLGTDGAASNNNLSMLGEMQSAALVAKGVAQSATALNAHEALRMATLGSAKSMGLEHQIGSIEIGKWADLAAIDMNHVSLQPVYDPASQIVYSAGDHHVSDVWVAGRQMVENGAPVALDMHDTLRKTQTWQQRFSNSE
ncbi:MAG: TRZ/ATZ family hydrolase [Pseudomonadota bacterium]